MTISVAYETAADVAHAVKDEISDSEHMAFPYNRFNPEESDWWVSPEKENPAYKYAKYAFDPNFGGDEDLLVGVHIEKGFGQLVAQLAPSAKHRRHIDFHIGG